MVWGKSDNLRVTDVLNPLDNREPGLVDIEDLRLPTTMTKLDLYLGDWNLSGMVVHEVRFNKAPALGRRLLSPGLLPPGRGDPGLRPQPPGVRPGPERQSSPGGTSPFTGPPFTMNSAWT